MDFFFFLHMEEIWETFVRVATLLPALTHLIMHSTPQKNTLPAPQMSIEPRSSLSTGGPTAALVLSA